MLIIHIMLNASFIGDTQNLRAVTTKLTAHFAEQPIIKEYQDCAHNAVALLVKNLDENQHVLLISGTHGLNFLHKALTDDRILLLIGAKKLIISWCGHQAPEDLKTVEGHLSVVSLVQESIGKSLEDIFGVRLVSTKMVPNTLNAKTLTTALAEWHKKNVSAEDSIPNSTNGYIGVFLGGDAPDEYGNHKCYTAQEAFKQGETFGSEAIKMDKILLVTNGPRMGRIYPESQDPKRPVLTRFNAQGKWRAFNDLTEAERNTEPTDDFKAHAINAPLDPVSAAFIDGIKSSGLTSDRYRFIDFRFGKSAYQAIISALFSKKDISIAYYSGESVSYAEIGYFIPKTYAFEVSSMSDRHKSILSRFSQILHLVGKIDLSRGTVTITNEIECGKKLQTLEVGTEQDAQKVADTIFTYITPSMHDALSAASVGKPLTWVANRDTTTALAQEELAKMKTQIDADMDGQVGRRSPSLQSQYMEHP